MADNVQEKEKVSEVTEEPKKGRKKEIDYSKFSFVEAEKETAKEHSDHNNKEAMRLVRCRISSNDPNKQNWQGEIFCVRNKKLPEIKKMVPYNVITHIPQIMLNMIKEKKVQKYKEERLPNGSKIVKPYLIQAYNVEVLSPITSEEFNAIKQHQLAEGNDNV